MTCRPQLKNNVSFLLPGLGRFHQRVHHLGCQPQERGFGEADREGGEVVQSHHLEELLDLLVPKKYKHCANFIAHRHLLTDPQLLKEFGIEHYIGAQNEGELTVVLPRAYHTGV